MPSTTLTYTAEEGQRIAHAVGRIRNLKNPDGSQRSATAAECKDWLNEKVRHLVKGVEQQEAAQAAADAITEIAPT